MGPIFFFATDLSPRDSAFRRAAAQGEAVADACAPILGFRPEIEVRSLEMDEGAAAPAKPGSLAAALEEHAARGRTLAFILPAILDFSVFHRETLVSLTREARRRSPSLSIHYDDADPCHRLVVQAFAESLWELLRGSPIAPSRLGVLVVASGHGDARARAQTYELMRLLWEQLAVARGEVAFVRHPRPSVPESLERCLASPLHWIAVPELLFPGEHLAYAELLFEDFRRAHPEAVGFQLAKPVGESPHVTAWLVERLLAIFRSQRELRAARTPSLVHAASARESCVIGPEASCTMDILPKPLGPDLAYGPGVIAEIVDTEGLARLLEHFEVPSSRVFIKVTWHGYATGTYTDAAALDRLLSALPGKAILLEGHSTGRNTGGAAFDWETESQAHRSWLRDQEAEFLRRTGIAEVIARHQAQYVNITEAYWDGECAPREDVLRLLREAGVSLRADDLAGYVPSILLEHRGAPFISFARFKGPTRLGISNCFGLLPPPLRSRFHGPTIDHFARVCCDMAKLYGALLRPYGLVEALYTAVRWSRDGLYRSRFGNYDLIANPGVVTLSRGLIAADVLASRLQGQDVRRSAFFAAAFEELGSPEPAVVAPIEEDLIRRFV
jgi:sirohydrochlorin ferrochelatase